MSVDREPQLRSGRGRALLFPLALALLVPLGVHAQGVPWAAPAYPDVLRWSSLPLDSGQADTPGAGEWWVSASAAYFNVWQLSWQTGRIHRNLGLEGQPLQPSEVELLVERDQADTLYHVDL